MSEKYRFLFGLWNISEGADRIGRLIESEHTILAALDPSDDMGYALTHRKLWSVHLNN